MYVSTYVLIYSLNFIFVGKQKVKRKRRQSSDPESDLDGMWRGNCNVNKLPIEFIIAN